MSGLVHAFPRPSSSVVFLTQVLWPWCTTYRHRTNVSSAVSSLCTCPHWSDSTIQLQHNGFLIFIWDIDSIIKNNCFSQFALINCNISPLISFWNNNPWDVNTPPSCAHCRLTKYPAKWVAFHFHTLLVEAIFTAVNYSCASNVCSCSPLKQKEGGEDWPDLLSIPLSNTVNADETLSADNKVLGLASNFDICKFLFGINYSECVSQTWLKF